MARAELLATLSRSDRRCITVMRRDGASILAIAHRIDRSSAAVSAYLNKRWRVGDLWTARMKAGLAVGLRAGMRPKRIAWHLGVPTRTVTAQIRRMAACPA
jgi:hypothetical protein